MYEYVFTQPLRQVGRDTTFTRITAGLNLEFTISKIESLIKAKEPNIRYYLTITWISRDGFMPFSRELMQRETQTTLFELGSLIPFPTVIIVLLNVPPDVSVYTCDVIQDVYKM